MNHSPDNLSIMRDWFDFFLKAGGTEADLRSSKNAVRMQRILEFIRSGSPDWMRKYPERHYSTFPYGSLEENQFLLDFSGGEIKLPKVCFCDADKSDFFQETVDVGVYLISLSEKKIRQKRCYTTIPTSISPCGSPLVCHWREDEYLFDLQDGNR